MARIILTDTSPLIGLARVSGLGGLHELFGKVLLTPEVLAEALPGRGHADEKIISQALEAGWLDPRRKNRLLYPYDYAMRTGREHHSTR